MTLIDSILRAGEPANESAGKRPQGTSTYTDTSDGGVLERANCKSDNLGQGKSFLQFPGQQDGKRVVEVHPSTGAGSRTSELTERA